ncbi:MAG: antitoxin [bacterium]
MATITIRGLDEKGTALLKKQAKKNGLSVNMYLLKVIKEDIGLEKKRNVSHHELDNLAGTWSEEDYQEFQNNIADFEKIDQDLWK